MTPSNQDSMPSPSTPTAPPPPYTEFAAGPSSTLTSVPCPVIHHSPSSTHHSGPPPLIPPPRFFHTVPTPMPIGVTHPGYGPTPLATNQPLLPYAYYESRGSADARARMRFVQALMCAMGLWMVVGFVIGVEILGDDGWGVWGKKMKREWGLDGVLRLWVWLRASGGASEIA